MPDNSPALIVRWADAVPGAADIGARKPYDVTVLVAGGETVVAVVPPEDRSRATLRRAAAVGVRRARDLATSVEAAVVTVDLGEDDGVAEGAELGWYVYAPVSGTPVKAPVLVAPRSPVAEAVTQARDWVSAPPNLQHPEALADEFEEYAVAHGLTCVVLHEEELEKEGYGGILAVGLGSNRPPRLARLSYDGGTGPHLVLVGKGITFDSGGLDIKPAVGMVTMRHDMAGAASVVAATAAIAELGLPLRVTAYAPLAENMPSGSAFRPSDVVTVYGGTTVESGNTDAEGRMVLADALVRAAEDEPDLIVDVATLTGAVITALGRRTMGLFARSDEDADRMLAAAAAAGERMWRLPIGEENVEGLDSLVADLRSVSADHPAGASFAAAFLAHFVAEDTAWAHLDIAGVAWNRSQAFGHVSTMGTGVGVATLVEVARGLC